MSVSSKKEVDNKEDIVDDITEKADIVVEEESDEKAQDDKLAALKAKMAKKQKEDEMPPEIVEDTVRSIRLGVIGSGQAGCIDKNTNLMLSSYGIVSIEHFFQSELACASINNIDVQPNSDVCVRLSDDVYTTSINPETGEVESKKVLAVWKLKKQGGVSIKTESGTVLNCSKKHPSLVFEPKTRKRAFWRSFSSSKPLGVGDRVIDTRCNVADLPQQDVISVRGVEINQEIAWLLGLFAGDGSTKSSGNEISFYLSDDKVLLRAQSILEKLSSSVSISNQISYKKLSAFGLGVRLFFETAFGTFNGKTYGGSGSKTYTVDVPRCISANTPNIRGAFIAGLVDADGTISKDWCETSIFTTSKAMSDKLGCLISSIGGRSTIEMVPSRKPNESIGYRIRISSKFNHGPLMSVLVDEVTDAEKKHRLSHWYVEDQKSFTTSSALVSFDEMSSWMVKEGQMTTINNLSERAGVNLKNWTEGKRRISLQSFNNVIDSLEWSEQLLYVKNIAPKLDAIDCICECDDFDFYDLTVEGNENYIAGNNGFVFTHNSRLSECFYDLGYPSVAVNTAKQDLEHIKLPSDNKLLLDYGMGGAAKELDIGHAAATNYRDDINQLVMQKLNDAQVLLFCTSLGGGSGAGSVEPVIDILLEVGVPIAVITVLPQNSDDAQTKDNAVKTLTKLTKMAQARKIDNLIVVDNAKIEAIYSDVGQMQFFPVSNKAIVDPIDRFNTLSARASSVKGLDPTEFGKLFTDGQGLTIYGKMVVENYEDETAIAEAVIEDLSTSLLASGFNIKQARYVGAIFVANQKVWDKIPSASVNYAMSMINDACGSPLGIFKGIYADDEVTDDVVHVYSMFSGLGLPSARIDQLKTEASERIAVAAKKDEERKLTLNIEAEEETVSAAQAIQKKIAAKKSAFSKLHGRAVLDRRKK